MSPIPLGGRIWNWVDKFACKRLRDRGGPRDSVAPRFHFISLSCGPHSVEGACHAHETPRRPVCERSRVSRPDLRTRRSNLRRWELMRVDRGRRGTPRISGWRNPRSWMKRKWFFFVYRFPALFYCAGIVRIIPTSELISRASLAGDSGDPDWERAIARIRREMQFQDYLAY